MDSHLGLMVENREDIFVSCSGFPLVVAFHVAVKDGTIEKRVWVVPRFTPPLPVVCKFVCAQAITPNSSLDGAFCEPDVDLRPVVDRLYLIRLRPAMR
jgi:hypothetical protein